jgi:hypothetical protein
MKKQPRRLSLSKETLYTLESGSLTNAVGGSTPALTVTVTIEVTALTYATYKLVTSHN